MRTLCGTILAAVAAFQVVASADCDDISANATMPEKSDVCCNPDRAGHMRVSIDNLLSM